MVAVAGISIVDVLIEKIFLFNIFLTIFAFLLIIIVMQEL